MVDAKALEDVFEIGGMLSMLRGRVGPLRESILQRAEEFKRLAEQATKSEDESAFFGASPSRDLWHLAAAICADATRLEETRRLIDEVTAVARRRASGGGS